MTPQLASHRLVPAYDGDADMTQDPHQILASLAASKYAIDLKTLDLCFLAALKLRADRDLEYTFGEGRLIDVFEQVCEAVEPGGDNLRTRASHTLRRMREQRMLARVDGAGIAERGDYTLTHLATSMISSIVENDSLTKESLEILTNQLVARLAEILGAARRAETEEEWRTKVTVPMRVVVRDSVSGIERRQRGIDSDHEKLRREITDLISAEWHAAIDHCQDLLAQASGMLSELNNILLRGRDKCHIHLNELQSLADEARHDDAQAAIEEVSQHVERVAAWGKARQHAWSVFYQQTHAFLRDVVRLDPKRALSKRLRDQIVGWPLQPFFLAVARGEPIRLLRPMESKVESPPVTRARTDRSLKILEVLPEDDELELDALVAEALESGASSLAEVTEQILPQYPEADRYLVTGRVAEAVARLRRVAPDRERPWQRVSVGLEIEDWRIPQAEDAR